MSTLLYFLVFAALMGSTVAELNLIGLQLSANVLITTLIGLAGVKAVLIALFFQHLKDEPRSLSSVLILALIAAFVLMTISFLQVHMFHI